MTDKKMTPDKAIAHLMAAGNDLAAENKELRELNRSMQDAIGDIIDYATDKIKELTWGE